METNKNKQNEEEKEHPIVTGMWYGAGIFILLPIVLFFLGIAILFLIAMLGSLATVLGW